jgi:hypothetical protein
MFSEKSVILQHKELSLGEDHVVSLHIFVIQKNSFHPD